ncbi:hypothetical protein [Pseudobacteriovorax antillogorgiicola]|nr:hypothetical protein [Pseudobacteriovorax antillogorgiicola]
MYRNLSIFYFLMVFFLACKPKSENRPQALDRLEAPARLLPYQLKAGQQKLGPQEIASCKDQGAMYTNGACLHGIARVYSGLHSFVAQRSDGGIVAWGRGGEIEGYEQVRDNLQLNKTPIKDVVFVPQLATAVLLENGDLFYWGKTLKGKHAEGKVYRGIKQVAASNEGLALLHDPDGDGCDDGCIIRTLGIPAPELADGVRLFSNPRLSNVFIVLRKNGQLTQFPDRDHYVSAHNWLDLTSLKDNENMASAHILKTGVIVGLSLSGHMIAWGQQDKGANLEGLAIASQRIASVSSNRWVNYGVTREGLLIPWGDERFFKQDDETYRSLTKQLDGVRSVKKLVHTESASMVLQEDGRVRAWGLREPVDDLLTRLGDQSVRDICATHSDFAVLSSKGELLTSRVDESLTEIKSVVQVREIICNRVAISYVTENGEFGVLSAPRFRLGSGAVGASDWGVRSVFTNPDGYASIVQTEDLLLHGVGPALYGADLTMIPEHFDRVIGDGEEGFATVHGKFIRIRGDTADNRFIQDIDGTGLMGLAKFRANVILHLDKGEAYHLDTFQGTRQHLSQIVDVQTSKNGYALLQAQGSQNSCEHGCNVIPYAAIADKVKLFAADRDPSNDIRLTGIIAMHLSGNYVYLFDRDGGLQMFRDDYQNNEFYSYRPDNEVTKLQSFVAAGESIAALTRGGTVISGGPFASQGEPSCSRIGCILPHRDLENVVSLVVSRTSFTALMSSKGHCHDGCSVTSWGYIPDLEDTENPMAEIHQFEDFEHVYASASAFLGIRTNGQAASWGSARAGADENCDAAVSRPEKSCHPFANGSFDRPFQLHYEKDFGIYSQGFFTSYGSTVDFFGESIYYSSMALDKAIEHPVKVHYTKNLAVALHSQVGDCQDGCNFSLWGMPTITGQRADTGERVTHAEVFADYIILHKKAGGKMYLGLPDWKPNVTEDDYKVLIPQLVDPLQG